MLPWKNLTFCQSVVGNLRLYEAFGLIALG